MIRWYMCIGLWRCIWLHDKYILGSSLPFCCCVFCCVGFSFAMIINLLMWADARNTRGQPGGDGLLLSRLDLSFYFMSFARAMAHVLFVCTVFPVTLDLVFYLVWHRGMPWRFLFHNSWISLRSEFLLRISTHYHFVWRVTEVSLFIKNGTLHQ